MCRGVFHRKFILTKLFPVKTRPNWAREVREIYPGAISQVVKWWAFGLSGGQGVGLRALRGSRGRPTESQGVKW